jgi:predicted RND superfamily exporter protein
VYDRIRENLRHRGRGETFADVSDRSITQTFDRSINTSLTVLLVVAALVFFGGESIRQFNIALLIGIAIGTYSSIFVASPLVVLWERTTGGREAPARTEPRTARGEAVAIANRPRRETVTVTTRPSRPTVTGEPGAEGSTGDAAGSRPRPGAVRPKKKRRL